MRPKIKILVLVSLSILGVTSMIILFQSSEKIMHYENSFIRRFPPHAAQEIYKFDLKYNSYYFAGTGSGKIYLGNYTTPLVMSVFDTLTRKLTTARVQLDQKNLPFSKPQIKVHDDDFVVYEGSVPYLFLGNTKDWKAKLRKHSGNYFSQLEIIDSAKVAVRFIDSKSGESVIGTINLNDTAQVNYNRSFLQKQIDGIFDTDGSLHYNPLQEKLVYVYRYRNQYIVGDNFGEVRYRNSTIDTISRAKLSLKKVQSKNYKTFAEPPLVVNSHSTTYKNLLFINSMIPGRFENDDIWKRASIIDVYDLDTKTYRSSFPLYHIGKTKMKSFLTIENKIYVLITDQLVCYNLLPHLMAETRN